MIQIISKNIMSLLISERIPFYQ